MFLLFQLLLIQTISTEKILYIANDGVASNIGSYENPLPFDWDLIKEKVRENQDQYDSATIIFKKGTYFSDPLPLMGWDYNQEYIQKITITGEDEKETIIHGGEKVTGWKQSEKYPKLWYTEYNFKKYDTIVCKWSKSNEL